MTTFTQFQTGAKTRPDYSDMIQVRYPHPNGEAYDTWVSGEEVLARLNTRERERLIKSFSRKNWGEAKDAARQQIEKGKEKTRRSLKDRLADAVFDGLGDNIFGDTLADNIRGVDSNVDPRDKEKAQWQSYLRDDRFRTVLLEIAWRNIETSLPPEENRTADDWI